MVAALTLPSAAVAERIDPRWPALERLAAERFGIRAFRPGQRELIDAVLAGEDALGVLPTGSGKSLTYQLPALVLDRPVVVVVSPLISLMRDQREHMDRAHVGTTELDSTLTRAETCTAERDVKAGACPLIYLTPERLSQDACVAMLKERGVGLIVVDEAHCVSSWGHDFRPAYLAIAKVREALGTPPILALTATATAETTSDIVRQLGMRSPRVMRDSVVRPNLRFAVRRTVNEMAKRLALMMLFDEEPGSGIVYAATVKMADSLFAWIGALGISVARYHGKMTPHDRAQSQARFMSGTVRVMVATKAFGMGVDKLDIRFVVHHAFPDSLESYVQEAGRAGRDGNDARCVLLYRLEDRRLHAFFAAQGQPTRGAVLAVCAELAKRSGEAAAMPTPAELAAVTGVGERKVHAILAHLERLAGEGVADDQGTTLADRFLRDNDARKLSARRRLDAIMHYGQSTTCRVVQMTAYFGERTEPCSECDACRRQLTLAVGS